MQDDWDRLIRPYQYGHFNNKSMFKLDAIDPDFLRELDQCTDLFMNNQIATINDNYTHFGRCKSTKINQIKVLVANYYIRMTGLTAPVTVDCRIVPAAAIHTSLSSSTYCGRLIDWDTVKGFWMLRRFFDHKINVDRMKSICDIRLGKRVTLIENPLFFCGNTDDFRLDELFVRFCCDSPKNTNNSSLFQYISSLIDATIINAKDIQFTTTYSEYQRTIFDLVYKSSRTKNNLIFLRVPLLTNFLAGLFYLLTLIYDKIYLHVTGVLVLSNRKPDAIIDDIFDVVHRLYESISIDCCGDSQFPVDILQIIRPNIILNNDSFYNFVWNYNETIYRNLLGSKIR